MSPAPNYIEGVPCWVDTLQHDIDRAKDFYAGLFGWSFRGPGPLGPDGAGEYWVAQGDEGETAGLGTQPEPPIHPIGWNTYIAVDDLDAACARVVDAGGAVVDGPFDALPAGRMAACRDPHGADFVLWKGESRAGATQVTTGNSWLMSTLESADRADSKRFYAAVFGWTFEDFDGQTVMRVDGYHGGTELQPVPRDVVAVLGDSGNGRSAWVSNFAVPDMDAAVETVLAAGGSVLEPPQQFGAFRIGRVKDPGGAELQISSISRS